jgi:hypothetical protein
VVDIDGTEFEIIPRPQPNSPPLSASSGEEESIPLTTTKTIGEDGSTTVTTTLGPNELIIETDAAGNETVTYKGFDGSVIQTKIDPSTNTKVETIIKEGNGIFTDTDGTEFEIIPRRPRVRENE